MTICSPATKSMTDAQVALHFAKIIGLQKVFACLPEWVSATLDTACPCTDPDRKHEERWDLHRVAMNDEISAGQPCAREFKGQSSPDFQISGIALLMIHGQDSRICLYSPAGGPRV